MLNRINEMLDFQAQALALRSERQKVLAGNIANADTPRYKAVDFNFADALRAATGQVAPGAAGGGALNAAVTHAKHLTAGAAGPLAHASLAYRNPHQATIDNNTVDPDLERSAIADNSVRYEATLKFLTGQIRTLSQAITGSGQ
jgi:flagellar basal-body rod protein FlgB